MVFGLGKKKEKEIVNSESPSKATDANVIVDKEIKEPENIEEVKEVEEKPEGPPPLTEKEAKALKRSRYEEKIKDNPKFKNTYIIRNKRTGQIVQLRAASGVHAANIIGWRPRRVQVLDVQTDQEPNLPQAESVEIKEVKREASPETTASA